MVHRQMSVSVAARHDVMKWDLFSVLMVRGNWEYIDT